MRAGRAARQGAVQESEKGGENGMERAVGKAAGNECLFIASRGSGWQGPLSRMA